MVSLEFIKKNYIYIIFGICFIVGMYLRLDMLHNRVIDGDEWTILWTLDDGDFKPIWKHVHMIELHYFPGLYLTLWPFYQAFGESKWGLMIPQILFTVLGYVFLLKIVQSHFKTFVGCLVAFVLFTFNNELMWHSLQLRHYSVLPTMSLIIFYYFHKLFETKEEWSLLKLFLFALFLLFTSLYHPYGFIIISMLGFYFLLTSYSQGTLLNVFQTYGKFIVITYGLCLFLFWYYGLLPNNTTTQLESHKFPVFAYIPNPLLDAVGFIKGIVGNLVGHRMLYISLAGFLALFYVQDKAKLLRFLLVLIVIPLLFILTVDLVKSYWFLQRQFIWVTPLFIIFLAWCWDSLYLSLKQRFSK